MTRKWLESLLLIFLLLPVTCKEREFAPSEVQNFSGSGYSKPFGDGNYKYGLFLAQTRPPEINANMTLEQIEATKTESDTVRKSLLNSIKKTFFPLFRVANPALLGSGMDLKAEILKGIYAFVDNFKENIKKERVRNPSRFQIMIVPKRSDELVIRNTMGEVPLMRFYSKDKYALYTPMENHKEAYKSARDVLVTEMYQGMGKVMEDHYYNNPKQPFFLSLILNVDIDPNPDLSKVFAQVIMGMPINHRIPFDKKDEKIHFKWLNFPTVEKSNSLSFYAQKYPCAFIQIDFPFKEGEPQMMHINFGPVGTYRDGRWVRPPGVKFKDRVPKLTGLVKNAIEVDFNIFNLSMNLQLQEVTDLDLFLSVGLKAISKFKVGTINKTDIDDQFQAEINKTIQQSIAEQKQKLVGQAKQLAENYSPVKQEVMASLMSQIFQIQASR